MYTYIANYVPVLNGRLYSNTIIQEFPSVSWFPQITRLNFVKTWALRNQHKKMKSK